MVCLIAAKLTLKFEEINESSRELFRKLETYNFGLSITKKIGLIL